MNLPHSPKHRQALKYAEDGLAVFPCLVNGKRPACARGFKDATTDLDEINAWWTKNPDYNIGAVPASVGCTVVDIDVKDGKDGQTEFSVLLLMQGEAEEPTATVDTPSGGEHRWYRGEVDQEGAGKLGKGLDVRHDRGYVLMPPSTIGDKSYAWREPALPKAALPAAVVGALKQSATTPGQVEISCGDYTGEWDLDVNIERAVDYLRDRAGAVQGDQGDEWTMGTAADLRKLALSEDAIHDLMAEHFNPKCDPPWELEGEDRDSLRYIVCRGVAQCEKNGQVGLWALDDMPLSERFGDMSRYVGEPARTAEREQRHADLRARYPHLRPQRRSEFLNMPPPQWLYRKLIPQNVNAMLVGAPGTSKTGVMLELAACATCGLPAFRTLDPVKTGAVFYIVGEGEDDFKATRVKAWEKAHEVTLRDDRFFVLSTMPQVSAEEEFAATAAWIEHMAGSSPVVLIVLDTLATAAGGLKENTNEDMQRVAEAAKRLQRRFGCTAITLHHPPKGKDGEPDPRGGGALRGAYDTILTTVRGEGALSIDLGVLKQRAGPTDVTINLRMEVVDVGASNPDEMTTALVPVAMNAQEVEEAKTDANELLPKVKDALIRRGAEEGRTALTTAGLARAVYECENPAARGHTWRATSEQQARINAIAKQLDNAARRRRLDFDQFNRRDKDKHRAWSLPAGWRP
jgi:AAA domain/Bifunctional DNA primase/polymerase, N-terminal